MLFQPFPEIGASELILLVVFLVLIDILLLKLGLIITNAQYKRNWKWVAGSFGIQFGIVFFISSPLILYGMIGEFQGSEDVITIVILFSIFIDLNVINILHKIGLKRSLVIVFFVVGPIVVAMIFLGSFLGGSFQ